MPMVHAPTRKPNLNRQQYVARFLAERARQERRYCDAFDLWRRCANKRCIREFGCCGDAHACLERALFVVPHKTQWQARKKVLDATPHTIGAPELAARQCMPLDCFAESPAGLAAQYFARFARKPPSAARR